MGEQVPTFSAGWSKLYICEFECVYVGMHDPQGPEQIATSNDFTCMTEL